MPKRNRIKADPDYQPLNGNRSSPGCRERLGCVRININSVGPFVGILSKLCE